MKMFDKNTIETIAKVMADSFGTDPLNQALLHGLTRKDELLHAHSMIHIDTAIRANSLKLLDGNPKAFLVGLDSNDESVLRDIRMVIKVYLKTLTMLGWRDVKTILSNNKKVKNVVNFKWQKEFIKNGYYRIKIVAVDKELRGTGAFRRLVTPVLDHCDELNIPIVLETHNYNNVGLYEHFGFQLVKTIESGDTDVKQYCMIRNPDHSGNKQNQNM
jgi:GNAT superfamily N-acetyltransferase